MSAADAAASSRSPAETARRAFEIINAHDLDALGEIMHPDNVNDIVAVGLKVGREDVLAFFRETIAAFPDIHFDVLRIVGDDTVAFVQWQTTATFTGGPVMGIEPTGSRLRNRGVDCMEVVDGRVQRNTIYYDSASLARDMGMLPAQGSVADRMMIGSFNLTTRLKRRLRARRRA